MAEPNNSNVAATAYVVAVATGRLTPDARQFYAALARSYAEREPTKQNAPFWNDMAALIGVSASIGTPAAAAGEAAIKRSGLSVSASSAKQLDVMARHVASQIPQGSQTALVWLVAAGLVGFLVLRKRG